MSHQDRDDRRQRGDDRNGGRRHLIPDQDQGEPGGRQGVGGANPQHRESFERRATQHGGQQRYQPGHQRSQGDWQRGPQHQQGRSGQHGPDPEPRREGHGQRTGDRDQQETGRRQFSQHEGPFREHGQQSVQRGRGEHGRDEHGRDEHGGRSERGTRRGGQSSDPDRGRRDSGGDGPSERARRSRGHPERHYREHLRG